jgi:hypothetical protein
LGKVRVQRGAKFPGEGCADHDKFLFPPKQNGKSATDRALPHTKLKNLINIVGDWTPLIKKSRFLISSDQSYSLISQLQDDVIGLLSVRDRHSFKKNSKPV